VRSARTILAIATILAATASAAHAQSPSGQAMPGTISGWRQTLADDFTGSTLSSKWNAYWGQPGGDPGGWWDPSHVTVGNGVLTLRTYSDPTACVFAWGCTAINNEVSGGLKGTLAQTYGKYEVRFRIADGQGVAFAALLWPANNSWPPEIDFAEDNGANPRTTNYATLHYGPNNTQVGKSINVDMTQWHTLGVEWTKGQLAYTLDGKTWATVKNSQVPSIPMNLAVQTQAWGPGNSWEQPVTAATPAEVDMQIDWIVAYAQSK
jgi:Glycosyl hydrolases family 16